MCKACDRIENYYPTTVTGVVSSLLGLWYTFVVPGYAPLIILLFGSAFVALFFILQFFKTARADEEQRLLSSQYLIIEEDVEANEKLTFGLDNITTNQLRFSIAKEISRENQAVNFVLETTQDLDMVVSLSRFMLGFYVWISTGIILAITLIGWTYFSQILLPIAVLLPTLAFSTPIKSRKQAIVITSKNIIIAQQASRKVRISSIKFTDVKEIRIKKTEGYDQYGQLSILKNDDTRQVVFQLTSIADFEAALTHAQFEGKLQEKEGPQLARNRFTRNYMKIMIGFSLVMCSCVAAWMIVDSFWRGFNWIKLWAGLGMIAMGAGFYPMRHMLEMANPFIQDVFVYTRRT
jgi:hypothetical protein